MAGLLSGAAGGVTVFALQALLSLNSDAFSRGLDSARGEANSAASVIANTFGITGEQIRRGLTVAAGALAGITALAVNSYSEYEQMVGGAQLLFGDAYNAVANNARTAFRRVQMSQSEYLGQVNRYAVGLRDALNGDTLAAADLADRILVAQADIVAATGQSQEMVQNAFNGIMRSNFTMLDNLNLGIKPTKEGFEEMIARVNEWNASQGRATEYVMDNYADMEAALVDYVEMQGMAGYSSAEAMGTIQGATASAKAAWQDLLAALASGENVGEAIDNLMGIIFGGEDGGGLLNQILPMIGNVLDGIGQFISRAVPIIAPYIPQFIKQIIPTVIAGVATIVTEIGKALPELIMSVWQGLADAIEGIFEEYSGDDTIFGWLAENGETVATAILAIAGAFVALQIIGTIITLVSTLGTVISFLAANPIVLIIAAIAAIVVALITLWNTNEDFRNGVINIFTHIRDFFVTIFSWINEHIIQPAKEVLMAIGAWLYEHVVRPIQERVEVIKQVFWAVVGWIYEHVIRPQQEAMRAVIQFFQEHVVQPIQERIEVIKNVFWMVVGWMQEHVIRPQQEAMRAVIQFFQDRVVRPIQEKIEIIKNVFWTVVGFVQDRVIRPQREAMQAFVQFFRERIIQPLQERTEMIKNTFWAAVNFVKTRVIQPIKDAFESFRQFFFGVVQRIISGFQEWQNIGNNIINGIREGMQRAMSGLIDSVRNIGNTISSTFRNLLGISSPSRVMRDQVGKWIPLGIAEGISDYASAAYDAVGEMVDELSDEANVDIGMNGILGFDGDSVSDMVMDVDSGRNGFIDSVNNRIDQNFNNLLGILQYYLPQLANQQIVLENGVIAGAVNRSLGLGY